MINFASELATLNVHDILDFHKNEPNLIDIFEIDADDLDLCADSLKYEI